MDKTVEAFILKAKYDTDQYSNLHVQDMKETPLKVDKHEKFDERFKKTDKCKI